MPVEPHWPQKNLWFRAWLALKRLAASRPNWQSFSGDDVAKTENSSMAPQAQPPIHAAKPVGRQFKCLPTADSHGESRFRAGLPQDQIAAGIEASIVRPQQIVRPQEVE